MVSKRSGKIMALCGITLMGIGTYIACFSDVIIIQNVGSIILIISIVISGIGFAIWSP
jgi:predicted amino acid racemase